MLSMLLPELNTILFIISFFIFMLIASRICKWFLLLFLYMIFVLLIRIFLISGDLSLSVSLLYYIIIIKSCFMALMSERWYIRQ